MYGCAYRIIDICLWTYDYIYMVTMYSYFDIRRTEPIQDNLDVIDMWLWIYIYGILRAKRWSKYSRLFLNITERYLPSTKLSIKSELAWYYEIKMVIKILLNIPECYCKNLNRYVWHFEIEMVIKIFQNIPEYYWKALFPIVFYTKNDEERSAKNANKFSCGRCDFQCSKESNYNRHVMTQ